MARVGWSSAWGWLGVSGAPRILTTRLELRPRRRGDGRALKAVLDDHVEASMGWAPGTRDEAIRTFDRGPWGQHVLVICDRPSGTVLGTLSVEATCDRHSIGLILGPRGRGRGLGREALDAALPSICADRPWGVVIETAEANVAMRRIAERTGFAVESHYIHQFPNGEQVQAVRYSHT